MIHGLEDPDSDEVKDVFKIHRPKTDILFGILVGLVTLENLLEARDEYPFQLEITDEELEIGYKEYVDSSHQFYRGFMEVRNQGIYVNLNFETNIFSSPQDKEKGEADILKLILILACARLRDGERVLNLFYQFMLEAT